jgi:hypothetical protein
VICQISSSCTARGPTAPAGARPLSACTPPVTASQAPQFAITKLAEDVARLRHVGGKSSLRLAQMRRTSSDSCTLRVRARRRRVDRRLAGASTSDACNPTPRHRRTRLCMVAGGRLLEPLRRRCESEESTSNARGSATAPHVGLGGRHGTPAWKSLPSWFLVAEGDQTIPPDAQRQFAAQMGAITIEVAESRDHGLPPGRGRNDDRDRGDGCRLSGSARFEYGFSVEVQISAGGGEPLDEVERRLGDIVPAVVDRQGMAPVRHLHDLRHAGV